MECLAAHHAYRARAVENLLQRVEDACELVKEKNYDPHEALRMIRLQCQRVRLIDEEMRG